MCGMCWRCWVLGESCVQVPWDGGPIGSPVLHFTPSQHTASSVPAPPLFPPHLLAPTKQGPPSHVWHHRHLQARGQRECRAVRGPADAAAQGSGLSRHGHHQLGKVQGVQGERAGQGRVLQPKPDGLYDW
eukprot:1157339-Pelagomonas_calceolata.AAC.7